MKLKLDSKIMFYVMSGILALLCILAIAGVVFGNQILQKKSNKLLALKLENRTLEAQQTSLIQAKKDIEKYSDLQTIAKTVVPQEKDQAKTVREIVNIASSTNVKISSIQFPTSTLGLAPPKANATTESGSSASAPTVVTPPLSQVKPVDNIKGLYQLEITVQSDANNPVPFSKLIDFLSQLEQNRRTAQVTSINVQPSAKNRDLVTFNLVVNVYIKP